MSNLQELKKEELLEINGGNNPLYYFFAIGRIVRDAIYGKPKKFLDNGVHR